MASGRASAAIYQTVAAASIADISRTIRLQLRTGTSASAGRHKLSYYELQLMMPRISAEDMSQLDDDTQPALQPLASVADGWSHFSLRATAVGLLLGILINLSNVYYGLQTGVGFQLPMVSGLLGYACFRLMPRSIAKPLTTAENVLVISAATATGCMPITASLASIIPALEFLVSDEDGKKQFSFGQLVLWCAGLCFFGIALAALVRKRLVERGSLPWPGPKASTQLLLALHAENHSGSRSEWRAPDGSSDSDAMNDPISSPQVVSSASTYQDKMLLIAKSSGVSGLITICMYFLPELRSLPIFGKRAANDWLWALDISPGFFGQGIITGVAVPTHMLLGAIIGWAILAPLAKKKRWAPGPIGDWDTGARAWIMWVALSALMADAVVNIVWLSLATIQDYLQLHIVQDQSLDHDRNSNSTVPQSDSTEDFTTSDNATAETRLLGTSHSNNARKSATSGGTTMALSTPIFLGLAFVISTVACIIGVRVLFQDVFRWYYTLLAIILALPMAVIGIRALGEADWNPNSTLLSQLVFANLVPYPNPSALTVNLIAAGLAAAGANQAGDIAYDFKVGQLVGAFPDAQILGHVIGSVFGALVSCVFYRLYTSSYPVPGRLFGVPWAYINIKIANLALGQGLPAGSAPFVISFGIVFTILAILRITFQHRWWTILIPSGTTFAIGMYNLPSFTISRLLGGLLYAVCTRNGRYKDTMIVLATGLILGESLASLINLAFPAFGL